MSRCLVAEGYDIATGFSISTGSTVIVGDPPGRCLVVESYVFQTARGSTGIIKYLVKKVGEFYRCLVVESHVFHNDNRLHNGNESVVIGDIVKGLRDG